MTSVRELSDGSATIEDNQDEKQALHRINEKTIEDFSKVSRVLSSAASRESTEFYLQAGLGLIVEATKCTNAMPSGASRSLYSAYPAFGKTIDVHSEKILSIISKVLKKQQIKGNIQRYLSPFPFFR